MGFSFLKRRNPLSTRERFGLAVGGVLTESNNDPFDRIEMSYGRKDCRVCLADWWGINSASELSNMVDWLFVEGHRIPLMKSVYEIVDEQPEHADLEDRGHFIVANAEDMLRLEFVSWDLSRVVNLARWGYVADYASMEQGWQWIHKAAAIVQDQYTCWKDTGDDFILGYRLWSMQFSPIPDIVDAYERLLDDAESVWNTVDWHTQLDSQ